MSSVIDEMLGIILGDDVLEHYGMPKRSGRYPYGSGDNPYQHQKDFKGRVEKMRKEGFTYTDENGKTYSGDAAIARSMGLSATSFRARLALAVNEVKTYEYNQAVGLRKDGLTYNQIAEKLGYPNESSVRSLLETGNKVKRHQALATADILRDEVDKYKLVEIGLGASYNLGVSKEKLNQAVEILKDEGCEIKYARVPQATNPGQTTTIKVLCAPDLPKNVLYLNKFEDIHFVGEDVISYDNGKSFTKAFHYPESLDSKRLEIKYAEDGGTSRDGLIEIRRGVKDLSLGDAHYAQVRIMVDGTHYLKGMAVYADDLPDGIDVRFNSNKPKEKGMFKALKEIKKDPENPFGSLIKEHGGQSFYDDPKGKFTGPDGQKQSLSLINKRAEEGDWGEWSDHLPSQMLSKQSYRLAKRQLELSIKDTQNEFDEILACENPTVKRTLLKKFAESCDSAAVHLQAAALPRQKYQVILPLPNIKDNEIYAPNYRNGEQVALIRYPHGGTFEIPVLTVNNKLKDGINMIGKTPKDAVGINPKVASQLSGADFDGDTVVVIPTNNGKTKITARPALKELEGFDTTMAYGPSDEIKKVKVDKKTGKEVEETIYVRGDKKYTAMKSATTQQQMGIVSNLICDMTIAGAPDEDLVKAVKHSMVVIDAEKHKLDYRASEIDNDIALLKKKYQKHYDLDGNYKEQGAATLISRAKHEYDVLKRVGNPIINDDGSLSYKEVVETYTDKKTGKEMIRKIKSTEMAEVKDANKLISEYDTEMEHLYANFANSMKAKANAARKEMVATPNLKYSPEAKIKYKDEVDSINAKLSVAMLNKPKERKAQALANAEIAKKKQIAKDDGQELSKGELKKIKQKAITNARLKTGASSKDTKIEFTDKEWEAVQAGAISDNKLRDIISNSDIDKLRERATPRKYTQLSEAKINKLQSMYNSGNYTTAEIAVALGCSSSTVSKYV